MRTVDIGSIVGEGIYAVARADGWVDLQFTTRGSGGFRIELTPHQARHLVEQLSAAVAAPPGAATSNSEKASA